MTENELQTVIDRGTPAPRDGEADDASLQTLTGLGPVHGATADPLLALTPLPLDSAPLSDEDPDIDEPTRVYMDPLARLAGTSARQEPESDVIAPDLLAPSRSLSERNGVVAHAQTLASSLEELSPPPPPRLRISSAPSAAAEAVEPVPAPLTPTILPTSSPRLTDMDADRSGPRVVSEHGELGVDLVVPETFTRPPVVQEPTLPRATHASDAPWTEQVRPQSMRPGASPLRWKLLTAFVAFAASVALTVSVLLFMLPKSGALLVTVAGASGAPVQKARVFLDGKPVCEQSPCWINELSVGSHPIRVQAPGYLLSPAQSAVIHANDSTAVHITLKPSNTARLDVRGSFSGVRLFLDDVDRGEPPLVLNNLAPGAHTLRLSGSPLYAPFEQRVELESDKVVTVQPAPALLKGTLLLRRGANVEGARIDVESADGRQRVRSLPASVELKPNMKYHVWVSREGYQDLDLDVFFDANRPEQELELNLKPSPLGASPAPLAPAPIRLEEEPATPAFAESALSLTSVPSANVIVDGRPQGMTPRQITVAPGVHSVVFLHPTLGRKSVTVTVTPGKPALAAVRF